MALGSVRIGDILQQVLAMVRRHHVRLEGDFVNVVISTLLLEGIGRSLNPQLDLLSSSLPILRQLRIREEILPGTRGCGCPIKCSTTRLGSLVVPHVARGKQSGLLRQSVRSESPW